MSAVEVDAADPPRGRRRIVGGQELDVEADGVSDGQREERKRGLVFEDAIPGVQAGKRAGMNGQVLS